MTIAGYAARAAALVPGYDRISNEDYYAPVRHLIPGSGTRTLDIGAGSGRDALWFAGMGHRVVAAEPVAAFFEHVRAAHPGIDWVVDALPQLDRVVERQDRFDFLNLSGVWQHLDAAERAAAVPVLAGLAAPGALVLMSLRHGPASAGRPVHSIDPDDTAAAFAACGIAPGFRARVGSVTAANRAAGVEWTWLALRAGTESRG